MIDLASDVIRYVLPVLITGVIGLIVAKHGKGDDDDQDGAESSQPATAEHWQQLVSQLQTWTDKRLAERDAKIERLDKRVSSLESRYRAALQFIRTLIRRHPDSSADIPAEIRHDL
ncbi:hypothetical protein [Corynebacterium sp. AOP12-C2-36]|uniref:hypothetical protein n=1 Tax=Corynebacterium sp. AOP12-C2-36 TaxID=3457723 RepID=UPI00403430EC